MFSFDFEIQYVPCVIHITDYTVCRYDGLVDYEFEIQTKKGFRAELLRKFITERDYNHLNDRMCQEINNYHDDCNNDY